jgi:hypothetical protein
MVVDCPLVDGRTIAVEVVSLPDARHTIMELVLNVTHSCTMSNRVSTYLNKMHSYLTAQTNRQLIPNKFGDYR